MSTSQLRETAVDLLRRTADKVKRSGNVPFPPAFAIGRDNGADPPLAQLVQGGRGGEVRLKLYLCITMMATAPPYDLRAAPTPMGWARMLALPPDTGPRRVSSNLKWLETHQFISRQRRIGAPPVITLLDAAGGGGEYVRPIEQGRYIGVPVELWTQGWLLDLSATGLAMLMVLMELLGGHSEPQYVTRHRRERYGLSPDTWTRGRKELEGHGLIKVNREPQGSVYDYYRLRNLYWVDKERLKKPPEPEGGRQ